MSGIFPKNPEADISDEDAPIRDLMKDILKQSVNKIEG
jgi:hypothetical protein